MRCQHRRVVSSIKKVENINNLKDICPRCTRSTKITDGGASPRLLTLYKSLCKNTKCTIHTNHNLVKIKKSSGLKKKRKSQNKLSDWHFSPTTNTIKKSCIIDDFDDDINSQDDIDFKMFKKIDSAVEDLYANQTNMDFNNTAGYKILKEIINKTIIWPLKKPETFKGLRTPPKGVLLFGPPGAGKTFLGKLIATETNSTFFNITPSVLISKWMGENEKLVRTMFLVAKARQPSVIFLDEIDSFLSKTTYDENGCLRRLKNEFLVCMDSDSFKEDRIVVLGATSRPAELDDGVRHKFSKRLYISLPDTVDRKEILLKFLECECHCLEEIDICDIVRKTEGFSIADIKNLCQEAAMGPVKILAGSAIHRLRPEKIRPISMEDFLWALQLIKPTVSEQQIKEYEEWDCLYGYGGTDSCKN